MKRMVGMVIGMGGLMLCAVGCGVDPGSSLEDLRKKDKKEEPPPATCRVTGGGQIEWGTGDDEVDTLGGNAQPFRFGGVDGEWNHITHEGSHFHGDPEWIECDVRENDEEPPEAGADLIWFGGTGTFDGAVCDFVVYIEDHGEPEADYYSISITGCTGGVDDYEAANELLNGNLQIHPVPPGHIPVL